MIVKETKNRADIHKLIKNPVIYDLISDDNSPCSAVFMAPITKGFRYIAGLVNGEIIGLLVYHDYKDGEKCHIQVLPEFRKEYANDFGKQSLEFRDKKTPLYAEIPRCYPNVLSYAKRQGFEVIAEQEREYNKNGNKYPIDELIYKGV